MRKFIVKLLIFLVPIGLLAIAADFFISTSLRNSKTYAEGEYAIWNDIYDGQLSADIFIYGSSRAVVHISPAILSDRLGKSVYNLGVDGFNFWTQYFRHQEASNYTKKPQTIVHSLDLSTLSDKGPVFYKSQFLPYMFQSESIESFAKLYPDFSYFDFRLPLVRYYGNSTAVFHALKLFFIDQPEELARSKGYRGQDKKWTDDLANAKKIMATFEAHIDSSCVALFEEYLVECVSKNINVVLVYTPEYIEGQHFVKNREEVLKIYKNLSTRYGVPFLDYSTDSISFDKTLFYNSGHLNKNGSERFTQVLANDLERILAGFTELP
jgi:hypothetical protein